MKISILCSEPNHPVCKYLSVWEEEKREVHDISIVHNKFELPGGDILFLISCHDKIGTEQTEKYTHSLLVHASDLPEGRGWSPHIWKILDGAKSITVSLLEAAENIDSGDIWQKVIIEIPRHYLYEEINHQLFVAEIDLMNFAVENINTVKPKKQPENSDATFYRKRNPRDSKLDVGASLAELFDEIRVCDPDRYPAYFKLHEHYYKLSIEKICKPSDEN